MLPLPARDYRPMPGSYGDQYVAATYCGMPEPPHALHGEWQHGWIGPERNVHPEFVVGGDGRSRERRASGRFFVAREDQVRYLDSLGYRHVQAIGLPITYVERPAPQHVPRSLLVMPAHSLPETREAWNADAYAAYVRSIAPRFSQVCLCVHKSCAEKGNWVSAFEKLGIRIVEGAEERDHNSLLRMAALFSQFEFVTSNAHGSHLVYASYFGCKASVAGPRPEWRRAQFENVPFYRHAPEVLDIIEQWNATDRWNALYPQLRREPWEAAPLRDWAAWQLGEQCKRSPRELRRLFGWDLAGRASRLGRAALARVRGGYRFTREARPLVATLGAPGFVAALQLRAAARKRTGQSRIWCGWRRRLSVRNGSSDIEVFRQHFARREILDVPFGRKASTVLDLGANIGVSVEVFRQLFPAARIIAVELEQRNAELCRANHRGDARVTVVSGAIWPKAGRVCVADVGDGEWAYRAGAAAGGAGTVPALTYRQLLDTCAVRSIDVLKMDIEGAEADILESAWEDIFGTAAVSIIEVHGWIEGVDERVHRALERARERFDLDVSRSGEFLVIRNRALAGT